MNVTYVLFFVLAVISLQGARSTLDKNKWAADSLARYRAAQSDGKKCDECKKIEESEKPTCKDKQKLVKTRDECNCEQFMCAWIDCAQFNFDEKKPIECPDCSEIPIVGEDCGCKKWECAPTPCNGTEHEKIESCDSECDTVQEEVECGCIKYSCVPNKPPIQKCSADKICGACERCVEKPWISEECSKKTDFTIPLCERKKCPEILKTKCGPCERATWDERDKCDCPVLKCKKLQAVDLCRGKDGEDICGKCQTCVTISSSVCPEEDDKMCQQKECPIPEEVRCSDCQEKITRADECGCATVTCRPMTCETPPVKPVCEGQCQEAVLETNACGCVVYACKPKKPISEKPTYAPRCRKECSKCHRCQWVRSEECNTWEPECGRKCEKMEEPENRHCYEEMDYDDCQCPLPLTRKPCLPMPKGDCPKGKVKVPAAVDACSCPQPNTCINCIPFVRPTCSACQDVVVVTGLCETGYCVQKPCPKTDKTCARCEDKSIEFNECNCPVVTCSPKTCGPKQPCLDGETKVGEGNDSCGCLETKCIPNCTPSEVCDGKEVSFSYRVCEGKCIPKNQKSTYWLF